MDIDRRGALRLLAGVGLTVVAACDRDPERRGSPAASSSPGQACAEFPASTAGPFPADGANGPNVLDDNGVVRQDITSSFAGPSGRAEGVPLTLQLKVVRAAGGCAPLAGAAVYLWHCDREGRYSLYEGSVKGENYLRGVQPADGDGLLRFATVFPGAYPGRWPHMHFEVFPSVEAAVRGERPLATSQLALPREACQTAYEADGYGDSASALRRMSFESDGVFRRGGASQLAVVAGDPGRGMTADLTVPV